MKIKQYIVLRPSISPSIATIGTAHATLACYLKFKDDPIVIDWISGKYGPFYKVICQANDMKHWDQIKTWKQDSVHITESSLDNLLIAIAFKPMIASKSCIFNELKLYGG